MEEKTYRIGEAAKLLNLKTYVLRFWETEFPQLAPHRTEKGQRLYTEQDIATLQTIRHLLHERGLTIEGARRILTGQGDPLFAEQAAGDVHPSEASLPETMQSLYSETLTEAVMAALKRAGQTGAGGYGGAGAGRGAEGEFVHDPARDAEHDPAHDPAHDGTGDEEDFPRDRQAIEAIVARVLASGHGIPPGAESARTAVPVGAAESAESAESVGPKGYVRHEAAQPLTLTGPAGVDGMKPGATGGKPEAMLPHRQDDCMQVVQEAIAELEALRELLKPRQCRGTDADMFF